MNGQRPNMLMPALIGGAVAGVLSAIPLVNCLCCVWIIGGAVLSAYLLNKDSAVALTAGDGAIVGVFCGIVAAVVDFVISIPFHAMSSRIFQNIMQRMAEYAEEMPEGWESWFERGLGDSIGWSMFGFVISLVVFSALGALGGIIGISLFKKKTAPTQGGAGDVPQDSSHRQP